LKKIDHTTKGNWKKSILKIELKFEKEEEEEEGGGTAGRKYCMGMVEEEMEEGGGGTK
jgi:hypothetical protein